MLFNFVILLVLGVIWGSSFLFIKLALESFEPFTLGAIRLVVGAVMILGAAFATGQPLPTRKRDWFWIFILGAVASALGFAFLNVGQDLIESSQGGIIITTVPLFTLVLAHLFTDDRMTWRKSAGVTVGFAGVLVLFGPILVAGLRDSIVGMLLVTATALCYAAGGVMTRRTMTNVAPLMGAGISLFFAAILTLPLAFALERPFAVSPTAGALTGALGVAIVSTGLAVSMLFVLIRRAGPNFTAMTNFLAPVVSITWGAIFLDEAVTWVKLLALVLLLLGVAIGTFRAGVQAQPSLPAAG